MKRVALSRSAECDLEAIDLQTIERFGLSQADATAAALEQALNDLANEPTLGHRREDLCPPGRALLFQTVLRRFMIVYQPTHNGIRVARILDGAQHIPNALNQDPGDDAQKQEDG